MFLDLMEFDKEFYDYKRVEAKVLKRFSITKNSVTLIDTDNQTPEEINLLNKQLIIIQTPAHCSSLQANITFE